MTLAEVKTIAVAEDPFVGRYLRTLLGRHGFHAVDNDLPATLRKMESGELSPGILITNTPAAFTKFAEKLAVIYMAAAPDPNAVRAFRHARILHKPFEAEQLLQALNDLMVAG